MNPRPEFFRCWVTHWSCDVTDQLMRERNVTGKMTSNDVPGYRHFKTYLGVEGLARVIGSDLEILAVNATKPGTGQFRKFVVEAKTRFSSITLWTIMNDELMPILARYGFGPCVGPDVNLDGTTSIAEGMRWRKADAPHFTCPECKLASYHRKDIENKYCGACHKFFGAA